MEEKNRLLDKVVNFLLEEKLLKDQEQMLLRLCLDEALVNAIEHGNQGDVGKKVGFCLSRNEDYWSMIVSDEGEGFKDSQVPNPDEASSLELDHGRGLLIMIEYLDTMCYNTKGNQLQMIRRLPQEADDFED
jgi:anti-sigma regulatory factor (Ser/Thr protein kinase)